MDPTQTPGFQRVARGWFVLVFGGVALLCLAAFNPSIGRTVQRAAPRLSAQILRGLLGITLIVHMIEASFAWRTAKRKSLPVTPWVTQTALVGSSSLVALHRQPEGAASE